MKIWPVTLLAAVLAGAWVFAGDKNPAEDCIDPEDLKFGKCSSIVDPSPSAAAPEQRELAPGEPTSIRLYYSTQYEGEDWAAPESGFEMDISRRVIDQIEGYGRREVYNASHSKRGNRLSHKVHISSIDPGRTDEYDFSRKRVKSSSRSSFRKFLPNSKTYGPTLRNSLSNYKKTGKVSTKYIIPCEYHTISLPGFPAVTKCIGDIQGQPVLVMKDLPKGVQPYKAVMVLDKYEVNIVFPDGHFSPPQERTPKRVLP